MDVFLLPVVSFSLSPRTNTALRTDVDLGELLCDSLDDAAGSTLLRFEISSTEVRFEQHRTRFLQALSNFY